MGSEVTFRCKEGEANVTIEPSDLNRLIGDVKTTILPTGEVCMTRGRLINIIEKAKTMKPTNLCNTPHIVKHEVVKENNVNVLKVEISPYESVLAYPYGGTVIVVRSANEEITLPIGYKDYNITYGDKYVTNISIELHPDMINMDLQFRVGYLTGKYMVGSIWENLRVNEATVIAPSIEPIDSKEITYQEKPPYGFSFTVKTKDRSNKEDLEHVSTTWRIYKKNIDQLELVWSKVKTDKDKDEIRVFNLVPSHLSYGKTYYITSEHQYNNGEYSKESELEEFTLDGIEVSPPPCLDVYPGKVTVSNPTFGCSDDIDIKIGNKNYKLDMTSIEGYYWYLKGPKGTKSYNTLTNSIQVDKGDVEPNTTYDLYLVYKHKNVGTSPVSKITFKTEPEFRVDPANLDTPVRIYKQMAYYGEVLTKDIMDTRVNYRGVYDSEELYDVGDEVVKDKELYICTTPKLTTDSPFKSSFVKANSIEANTLYKSELPSYKWLLNELGFNPYLNLPKIPSDGSLSNYLNTEMGTWIKCQNRLGRIVYISKFAMYNGVSCNDLIRIGIFHPKRRTVRIRNRLYYARLLTSNMETYYDAIEPIKKDKINTAYGSKVVNVGEDDLITYLLNGKLNNYVSTDLDMSTLEYKEIVYSYNKLLISKVNASSTVTLSCTEHTNPDNRGLTVRLVLEEIPKEEYPIDNINPELPGKIGDRELVDTLYEYDPYTDSCYLDYITVDNFLSSESINEKTNTFLDTCVPNLGWHKVYYKGLIYYISQGQNYLNVDISKIENMNISSPTPIYKKDKDAKYSKVIVNGYIFNVTLPEIVNYDGLQEFIPIREDEYNILTGDKNKDLKLSDKSFWSNVMYKILKDKKNIPNPEDIGYKGKYPKVNKDYQSVDMIGSTRNNGWMLSSDKVLKGNGDMNYLLNSEDNTYVMKEYKEGDVVNLLLVLTVSPTVGNEKIWDIKE